MAGYGDKPFGLNDVKIADAAGTTIVDLPAAQTLKFGETVVTKELEGDDQVVAQATRLTGIEGTLEAGGLPLEAYAIMTGRTASESGASPNRTNTLVLAGGSSLPYFMIYGKSLGEASDSMNVILYKCKLTKAMEGTFKNGEFLTTSVEFRAVDNGVEGQGIMSITMNETAADLPAETGA
jgi:hypothetical protein